MTSGIKVASGAVEACLELKSNKRHAYVVMDVKGETIIDISIVGDSLTQRTADESRDVFNKMKEKIGSEPCYVVFDFIFKRNDGKDKDKVIFIAWCPDCCKVNKKMIHSSSKDALRKKVGTDLPEFQCNADDDLDYDEIAKELRTKDRT